MKRKILTLFLALVCALCLAFGLAACGNSSSDTTDSEQNNEQTGDNTDSGNADSDNTDDDSTHSHTASEGLIYTLASGSTYEVSGIGTCTDTDIVIPSTYNDLPVTSIGYFAFTYCSALTSVIV